MNKIFRKKIESVDKSMVDDNKKRKPGRSPRGMRWRRRIRLCGRFPYRPTIGGACGMYRPSIGPVSAIERAIVCMLREMPGFSGLASADFEGVFAHSYKRCRPGFFYARCARNEGDSVLRSRAMG